MSSRKLSGDQLKKFRSDIAKLKAKGLTAKRIDARKQAPTRHMREKIKKFSDVLEGRAAVVKAPSRAKARAYSEQFRTVGKSIVVPVKEGERATYAPKQDAVTTTRTKGGKKIKRTLLKPGSDPDKEMRKREKRNVVFTIPLGNTRQSFDKWDDLVLFMEPYEANPKNPYKSWRKYVEIEKYGDAESIEE